MKLATNPIVLRMVVVFMTAGFAFIGSTKSGTAIFCGACTAAISAIPRPVATDKSQRRTAGRRDSPALMSSHCFASSCIRTSAHSPRSFSPSR